MVLSDASSPPGSGSAPEESAEPDSAISQEVNPVKPGEALSPRRSCRLGLCLAGSHWPPRRPSSPGRCSWSSNFLAVDLDGKYLSKPSFLHKEAKITAAKVSHCTEPLSKESIRPIAKGYHFWDISMKPIKFARSSGYSKAWRVRQTIARFHGPWLLLNSQPGKNLRLSFTSNKNIILVPAEFAISQQRKRNDPSSLSRAGRKDTATCSSVSAINASCPLCKGRNSVDSKIGAKFLHANRYMVF